MRSAIAAMLAGFVLLIACSDDPTGPELFGNDGGVGNQTLLVEASVEVEEVEGGFQTEFDVNVWDRDGEPVSGAEVVVDGGFGPMTLPETEPGDYDGELSGAAWGTLRLEVSKDSMFVRDVVLGNIGIHDFLEPEPNDTVAAGTPLMVRWFRDAEAPFARLSTRNADFENLADRGEFVIPDSLNTARSDQRLELVRFNEVQVAGGLRGSYFRMEVSNSVEPIVVSDSP